MPKRRVIRKARKAAPLRAGKARKAAGKAARGAAKKAKAKRPAARPKPKASPERRKEQRKGYEAEGVYEETIITCPGCGRETKVIKLSGISTEGMLCQRCAKGEVEIEDMDF